MPAFSNIYLDDVKENQGSLMQIVCFHNPDEENGYLSNWYPSGHIVAQELGFFLLLQLDNPLLVFNLPLNNGIAGDFCMHGGIAFNQSLGVHLGILKHF